VRRKGGHCHCRNFAATDHAFYRGFTRNAGGAAPITGRRFFFKSVARGSSARLQKGPPFLTPLLNGSKGWRLLFLWLLLWPQPTTTKENSRNYVTLSGNYRKMKVLNFGSLKHWKTPKVSSTVDGAVDVSLG